MLAICPKLRTFKLFVTESLSELGAILHSLGHTLDQISLVFPAEAASLTGFQVIENQNRAVNYTFISLREVFKAFRTSSCLNIKLAIANLTELSLPSNK